MIKGVKREIVTEKVLVCGQFISEMKSGKNILNSLKLCIFVYLLCIFVKFMYFF